MYFSCFCEFAVTTNISIHVDYYGTRFEILNCGSRNCNRCRSSKDTCSCDDDVSVTCDFTNCIVHFLNEFRCEWFCITSFIFEIIHSVDFNEATTNRFNLLSSRFSYVRCINYCTNSLGSSNCLQSSNS